MAVKSPRRTQQERREEAERRLLEAAARLIAHKGSQATTLAEVGDEAGYSRGIVHHHFGSKAALLERLARWVQDSFAGRVAPAMAERRGLDALVTMVEVYLAELASSRVTGQAFLVLWAEAAIGVPEIRAATVHGDRRFRRAVCRAVEEGQSDGVIRPDIEPEAVAASVVGQLRGIGLQLLVDRGGVNVSTVRKQVPALLRSALQTTPRSRA